MNASMPPAVVRLRDCLTTASRFKYLAWRLGIRGGHSLGVKVRTGERLILRPAPSTDVEVAMEIFAVGAYRPPKSFELHDVGRVVDLGANAGLSVVHFAFRHPTATIEAYEPHPIQLSQLRKHILLNNLENRVIVKPVAVSNRDAGEQYLTNVDAVSQLTTSHSNDAISVNVIDWLKEAANDTIDVLKIDIEGSERELVRDPRFRQLDLKPVMLEWHAMPDWPEAEREVKEVLAAMGMQIADGPRGHYSGVDCGVIWARKN